MEGTEVFHAKILATDDASQTIDKIRHELHSLGHDAERAGRATEHLHRAHVWEGLTEHIDLVHEHFGGLHASIGEVGNSLTELLPAMAAFGAGATLVGMFETVEHTAEAYGELAHTAQSLGLATGELHELELVAKLTDTNVEGLDKSVSKFNRTIAEAAVGRNKDAAALFAHLGTAVRDSNGHLRSAGDMLPEIADAFAHTQDAAMRTRMAFTLFGRSGTELIPMLMKGKEGLEEARKEAGHFGIDLKPFGEDLEAYNDSMHHLTIATGGFTQMLGGKLAPVLRPLIDEASEWEVANRGWITGEIAGGVKEFAHWLEHVPWHEVGQDIRAAIHDAHEFVDAIGGPKVAIEGLAAIMALKGVMFLAEPIREAGELTIAVGHLIAKLGLAAVAWTGLGTAAAGAGEAEAVAAAGGAGVAARAAAAHGASRIVTAAEAAAAGAAGAAESGAVVAGAESAAALSAGAIGAALELIPPVLIATIAAGALVAGGATLAVTLRELFGGERVDAEHPSKHVVTYERVGDREIASDRAAEHVAGLREAARQANRALPPGPDLLTRTWRAFTADNRTGDDLGLPFAGDAPAPFGASFTRPEPAKAELSGQIDVVVNLPNAPPGTTTTATVTGSNLISPRINTGQAWDVPLGL